MKTITFTNEEIEMIREDIESTFQYVDEQLKHDHIVDVVEREEEIRLANTAEGILKKLKD